MKLLLVVLVGIVVLLQFPDGGDADCCQPVIINFVGHCKDGTRPTPCCGYGPCNIFCCNCDGGCRKAKNSSVARTPLEVLSRRVFNGRHIVARGDLDGDGKMSLDEGVTFLGHLDEDAVRRKLRKMDKDGDGFLSPEEVDPSM